VKAAGKGFPALRFGLDGQGAGVNTRPYGA
jgi:hypothetical protein